MLTHGSSAGIFVLVILLAGCQPKQSASLHLSPMLEALTIFARRDF